MKFKDLRRNWDRLGELDPMWAIVSDPSRSNRRWEARQEEFFRSGEWDAQVMMAEFERAGVSVARERCLDFGCGLGRVTQALCAHFERVDGVDVAASMIRGARRHNKLGDRCQFHVNDSEDLRLFEDGTFDCVYSRLVLQHMRPEYSTRYISEFVRVLKPGGAAFFQVPAQPRAAAEREEAHDPESRLPDGAHQAEITVIAAPEAVREGEIFTIEARIRNRSPHRWPADGRIRLGNHWKRGRRTVAHDDGRVRLPRELSPGEEAAVTLSVMAPGPGGAYEVELDMVEEWITWFAEQGSPTVTVPVRVTGSLPALVQRALRMKRSPAVPRMEMHCVKPADVTATVAAAGGRVVSVTEWDVQDNPAYEDYRYVAVRAT